MDNEILEVWSTHSEGGTSFSVSTLAEIAFDLAHALDASDAFTDIQVIARRQEEVEWKDVP